MARLAQTDGRTTLTVSAQAARPVEVRLRFRDVAVEAPAGAAVHRDGPDTVVALPALSSPVTLTWTDS